MGLSDRLKNAVQGVVTRGRVALVEATGRLQLSLLDGETRSDIEHFQPFGFRSIPLVGARAIALAVGAARGHLVAFVDHPSKRPSGMVDGEVALYDASGTVILLKANGDVEIKPHSNLTKITGDVQVSGTLTAATDVVGGGKSLKNHTHGVGSLGGTSTSAGSAFTVTIGPTGTPS